MAETRWQHVADVGAFLRSNGRRTTAAHSPKSIRRVPWPVCSRCGLVYLRNDVTRAALSKPCTVEE